MKILFFTLLINCLPLCAMNFVPENTLFLSQEDAFQKVKSYHQQGLSASEGLMQDLRTSENNQVKIIFEYFKLDADQALSAIQSIKKEYDISEPTYQTTAWTTMLSEKMALKIAQKAETLGLDPSKLNIKQLDEHTHRDVNGRSGLPDTEFVLNINKNRLEISIKKRTFPLIELAKKYHKQRSRTNYYIKEKHPLTSGIIEHVYPFIAKSKNLSDDSFKKLNTNLSLAIENFAAQYALLNNISENPNYIKKLYDLFKDNFPFVYTRPGEDHISLFEECVAAENIMKLLEVEKQLLVKKAEKILSEAKELAEKKALFRKSRINPKSLKKNTGLIALVHLWPSSANIQKNIGNKL